MNQQTFDQLVDARCRAIKTLLASKGKEYAREDRLHNFKRTAGFLNKTPETACWGFAMKHITSIADLIDSIEADGAITAAPGLVIEKLGDGINYLILLEALVSERIMATASDSLTRHILKASAKNLKKSKRRSR